MHESEKWKWSRSVVSDSVSVPPHGLQPTRLLRPWDFPGKSTGVGCHCLLLDSHKWVILLLIYESRKLVIVFDLLNFYVSLPFHCMHILVNYCWEKSIFGLKIQYNVSDGDPVFSLIGNKRTDAYFNSYTKITGFQTKNSYLNMYMLYLRCHFPLKCWDWQVGWLWISFFVQLKAPAVAFERAR